MTRLHPAARILLAALALGLAVDLLFYGRPPGISAPIFTVAILAALWALARGEGVQPVRRNLWLAAPLVFFAAMIGVRANGFLTFLNMTAVLGLLALLAYFCAGGHVEQLGLLGYPAVLIKAGANAAFQAAPLLKALREARVAGPPGGRDLMPVLRGCLLALPVLSVFACLLSSADLIFARYLRDLLRVRTVWELLARGIVVALAAWVLAGGLAYALKRSGASDGPGLLDQAVSGLGKALSLGFVETAIVLGGLDLLFLTFVGVQFAYLFGGEANVTAQGFTYAEYARRGFGELVAVAILTLGLILGLRWLARREAHWQGRLFNGLSSLMVGLVLVILASAFQRLRLYEVAYGYTELRLYVYVFMVWLGLTCLWFAATLWWRPERFALGACWAALGFLVTLNMINPDAFITRQNLARYQAGGKLDAEYLATLSEDSAPLLVAALDQVGEKEQYLFKTHLRDLVARQPGDWQSFHLARWRTYDAWVDWCRR